MADFEERMKEIEDELDDTIELIEKEPEEKPVEEVEAKEEPEDKDEPKEQKRKGKTYQDRINDLTKARREAERREAEAWRRVQLIEERLKDVETKNSSSEYETAEQSYKTLKQARRQAWESQDFDKAEELEDKMLDAKLKMASAQTRKSQVTPTRQTAPQPAPQTNLDPQTIGWLARNGDWWEKDVEKRTTAFKIDHELKKEGFDPQSDDYWDELDNRLGAWEQNKAKPRKPVGQRVSSPSEGTSRKNSNGSFTVTREQQIVARRMGIEPGTPGWAKYVEQLKKQQESSNA